MKIALISLDQVWQDKEANKIRCARFIQQAATTGADIVIFPEMTLTGFSMQTTVIAEEQHAPPSLMWFSTQAKAHDIAIVMGYVVWNRDHSRAQNRVALIDAQGEVLTSYTKVHPFSYTGEDQLFEKGDTLGMCNLQGASVGLAICYDLRFPELYQALSKRCEIIITIANWPVKRLLHWQVLLQARAIENQVYMVGVNRTGIDGEKLKYDLSSHIYSPLGALLLPLEQTKEFALYEIDLGAVKRVQKDFPVKQDRRPDFYKSML